MASEPPPQSMNLPPEIGHWKTGPDTFRFCVWAPLASTVELELVAAKAESPETSQGQSKARWDAPWPVAGRLPMSPQGNGYWQAEASALAPGDLYRFSLDGQPGRPDPASCHQLHGVHGPSALVDHAAHPWNDAGFTPPALSELILYEMHIGVFTPEGTFAAAQARLDDLARLGVSAVQVMPVGQFPGERNWGYDGVFPFSVQHSYGGPEGFKNFVDACHAAGLAVILDVVYNHLGPEGNYLREFGPYFTNRYKTSWGDAFNFDGPESDHVRHYFFSNILHWLDRYHVDGFRLDATHAIFDISPRPFLGELAGLARRHGAASGRQPFILAENDLNNPRLALPPSRGGLGLSAIYDEDFHHCAHARLTGERQGYYMDYGRMEHLAKAATLGFAYTGQYSAYHRRAHGADPSRLPASALAVFLQNHDQTGNRAHGERLAALAGFEALKAAAGLLLLSPFIPMLFMGEEYGEDRPFLYFISHLDPELIQAVRAGRLEEFAAFHVDRQPPPDPQDERTFLRSKLEWGKRTSGRHGLLLEWHRELIRRRKLLGLTRDGNHRFRAIESDEQGLLILEGTCCPAHLLCVFNLSGSGRTVAIAGPGNGGAWGKLLDSADTRWGGPGSVAPQVLPGEADLSPWSVAIYTSQEKHP